MNDLEPLEYLRENITSRQSWNLIACIESAKALWDIGAIASFKNSEAASLVALLVRCLVFMRESMRLKGYRKFAAEDCTSKSLYDFVGISDTVLLFRLRLDIYPSFKFANRTLIRTIESRQCSQGI